MKKASYWGYNRNLCNLALSTSFYAIICAVPANAQQTEEEPQGLSQIVVTAERRSTTIQETPLSIVALTASDLEDRSIEDISDLQNFTANVSIGGSVPFANFPNASIRGVGQATARVNNDRGVALYIDELYYPRSTGSILQLLDVEQVEVLRGPQGTLFGRNATGGAIRYTTVKPKFNFEGRLEATYTSLETVQANGLLNIPLNEKVAARIQAAYSDRGGYINVIDRDGEKIAESGSREDVAIRGALRIEPSDSFRVDLSATYTDTKGGPDPTIIDYVENSVGVAGALGAGVVMRNYYWQRILNPSQSAQIENDPRILSPNNKTYNYLCAIDLEYSSAASASTEPNVRPRDPQDLCASPGGSKDENIFLNLDTSVDLTTNLTARLILGYQDLSNESNPEPQSQGRLRPFEIDSEVISQELHLKYTDENFDSILGIFVYDERVQSLTLNNDPLTRGPLSGRCCQFSDELFDQKAKSFAIFNSSTIGLTEWLNLTAGIRYTKEKKKGQVSNTSTSTTTIDFKEDWSSTDYRLTLDARLTDGLMIFGTASSGFKSGGFGDGIIFYEPFSGRPGVPGIPLPSPQILAFNPEKIENYELGVRSDWFNDHLRVNLTLFTMDYDGLVTQAADFSTGGRPQLYQSNAADVTIRGIEAEVSARPVRGMTVNATVGLSDTKLDRVFEGALPLLEAVQPSTCDTSFSAVDSWIQNCVFQEFARSPKWSYTIGANYQTDTSIGKFSISANYAFKDELETNNASNNSRRVESYGIINVRAALNVGSFEISAFLNNATDKFYATSGGIGAVNQSSGVHYLHPGPPREVGLTLKYFFGSN